MSTRWLYRSFITHQFRLELASSGLTNPLKARESNHRSIKLLVVTISA